MKKFSIMLLSAMALAGFTACDDAPAEPPMQSNPQEPVIAVGNITTTLTEFLQTPPQVIDLQNYVDNSLINVISRDAVANIPAGAEVKYYMELSPDAAFSSDIHPLDIEFLESNNGFVDAQRWSEAHMAMFGKNPEKVRETYYRIPVYVVMDGTEYRYDSPDYYVGKGRLNVRCIDTGFVIYPSYYLLSDATSWDFNTVTDYQFKHSDEDVYDDPVFTIIVETAGNCYWKIASTKTLETQDWETVYGPADNGDQNFVGKLVENGGAGCIPEPGKYKVTINMETLDYTIGAFNRPEYLCTPNEINAWKQMNSNWLYYSEDKAFFYGAVRVDPVWGFKFTDGDSWDDSKVFGYAGTEGHLTNGGDNIPLPQKGLYWMTANVDDMTYTAVLVESFGVIGGGDWGAQRNLTPNDDFSAYEGDVNISGEWKIRINDNWDYNFGGDLVNPSLDGANFPDAGGECHVVVDFSGNWPVITVTPL